MNRSLRWSLVVIFVGIAVVRVVLRHQEDKALETVLNRPLETEIRTDDPIAREAVTKAIKTPFQATSCRIKDSRTDNAHSFTNTTTTTELINPDKVHVREEVDRTLKSESFTDGRKLLVRAGPDAAFKEEAGDVAAKIKRLIPSLSAPDAEDKVAKGGHEDINGIPATIYKWESTSLYVTKRRLWVADADGRLLKEETESKGQFAFANNTIRIDGDSVTTYEYDPSITITLPEPSGPAPTASAR